MELLLVLVLALYGCVAATIGCLGGNTYKAVSSNRASRHSSTHALLMKNAFRVLNPEAYLSPLSDLKNRWRRISEGQWQQAQQRRAPVKPNWDVTAFSPASNLMVTPTQLPAPKKLNLGDVSRRASLPEGVQLVAFDELPAISRGNVLLKQESSANAAERSRWPLGYIGLKTTSLHSPGKTPTLLTLRAAPGAAEAASMH